MSREAPNAEAGGPARRRGPEASLAGSRRAAVGGIAWWVPRGAAGQAVVPGLYAWAVTTAPVAMWRGAPVLARLTASLAFLSVVLALVVERRAPIAARMVAGWGLSLCSAATWALASEVAAGSFDAAHGVAGMLGWTLFALVIASPVRTMAPGAVASAPLSPPGVGTWLDTALLVLGLALATALQIPGWRLEQRDRALLVRLVAVGGGLSVITVASGIAVGLDPVAGGDSTGVPRPIRRGAVLWMAAACAMTGAGLVYELGQRH